MTLRTVALRLIEHELLAAGGHLAKMQRGRAEARPYKTQVDARPGETPSAHRQRGAQALTRAQA